MRTRALFNGLQNSRRLPGRGVVNFNHAVLPSLFLTFRLKPALQGQIDKGLSVGKRRPSSWVRGTPFLGWGRYLSIGRKDPHQNGLPRVPPITDIFAFVNLVNKVHHIWLLAGNC